VKEESIKDIYSVLTVVNGTVVHDDLDGKSKAYWKAGLPTPPRGGKEMCKLCDEGKPQDHSGSQLGRRDFLKAATATGLPRRG